MSIFDNASSILIGEKEVASISINGGTVYSKSGGELREVSFTVKFGDVPIDNATVVIDEGTAQEITRTTGSAGGCTATLTDGTHTVKAYRSASGDYGDLSGSDTITVSADDTSFVIIVAEGS